MQPILRFLIAILCLSLFFSCAKNEEDNTLPDAEFRRYIAGFTSGVIFKDDGISIVLQEPSAKFTAVGDVLDPSILESDPEVKGTLTWQSDRSVLFIPEKNLKSGSRYAFIFHLSEVLDVEPRFAEFPFSIYTKDQGMQVEVLNLKPLNDNDLRWNQLTGIVVSADFMESPNVESMMTFSLEGKAFKASWSHAPDGREHRFFLDSVERKLPEQLITIAWDTDQGDFEQSGSLSYIVPSVNNFSYRKASIARDPEQYIRIEFTDPIAAEQALKGLVRVNDSDELRFEVESNVLKAYPKERLSGAQVLKIDRSVHNSLGYTLKENIEVEIDFTELLPAVKSAFSGTILPSTDGNVFPFQAVNLRAVDVEIKRIFENNILQFLQVNDMAGEYQLSRVGRTVLKKKVSLESRKALDYGNWNTFTLDLNELIKQEPGAIYQITLSFRPSYAIYPCEVAVAEDGLEEGEYVDDSFGEEEGYYDWEYDDGYYYVPGYDWQERDNPCHISYYVNRNISHNILATDLGLIAKRGKDGKTHMAVNNIKTAEPLKGVEFSVYDYQNQLLGKVNSGNDGTAVLEHGPEPFLLIAKRGKEKAYLKMGDGASLSMSHFDVRGMEIEDGLKGFIYTERGVWRPGDTLFLDFILEDAAKKLPKGHPVILELTDPRGHMVERIVRNQGLNGIYDFQLITAEDAPTGMWSAKVKVGAASFYKRLSVEAIKPNRLKMNLDFGKFIQEGQANGSAGKLTATWLHGAIAKNLKAEVSMVLNSSGIKPEGYDKYIFNDPARDFQVDEQILYEGNLDQEGMANIPLKVDVRNTAPGLLRAYFTTKVFEDGGGHSIDRFSIPYSPFERYIGIQMPKDYSLEAGSEHKISVVAVDKDGRPVEVEGLQVDVYQISWRWWWDSGSDYLSQYVSDQSRHRVQSFALDAFKGKTEFTLDVPEHEWSRYMLRVTDKKGGHSTGSTFYGYVPWRPGMDRGEAPGGATMLSFQLDKDQYAVGENAQVSIPTGGTGRALVSIEDGSHILQQEWLDVNAELMRYTFKVTKEMSPNAYVNVTLIQPHVRENELPIRMYGVTSILVHDPSTILKPTIKMPEKLKPETVVEISISEAQKKNMTYTLAVVDEGLLDLTGFKTPDPHADFYAREGLGVKTWDRYDDVIGAFGAMIQQILSVGGDEEIDGKQEEKINRFKPMVRHIGPFFVAAGKTNTHKVSIPNYVGSVRVMVIAAQDATYGHTEKTVKVSKPLMVLANLPRVLGPDEDVRLPVSIFAMEEGMKEVDVSIEVTGPLTLKGNARQSVHFSRPDEQMRYFDLHTGNGTGKGTVKVTAKGGGHTSTYEIELPVRESRLPESRSEMMILEPGQSMDMDYQHFAMEGTAQSALEFSSMPAIDLDGRLGYLTRYPHGCAEQTISSAFPQLYLKKFLGEKEELSVKSSKNIVDVIARLNVFQRSDGSFATWPGGSSYNDWVSSYVGHFMIEAKRMGYQVPANVYDRWLAFQKSNAKGEYSYSHYYGKEYYDKARSYRLFTLALAGSPDIASMNRLKASEVLDKPSIYLLASAYHMAGQQEVAKKLVAEHPHFTPKNRRDGYSYATLGRDQAILLDCMALMGMKREALPLVKQIAEALASDRYMDTHTTAFALRAMMSLDILEKKDMDFSASLNGKEIASVRSQLTLKHYEVTKEAGRSGKLKVTNRSAGPLYVRMIQTGIPSRESQKAVQRNVKMEVRYLDMQGRSIDISKLEQGTEFYVDLTVTNPNSEDPLEDLALTMVLPSGWEPNVDRMDAPENESPTDVPDYMDIRDDRVMLYFDLDVNDENDRYRWAIYRKHFRFTVNASYSGEYFMPGILVESMYDPEVVERKAGQMVEVFRPGLQ